jgi:hypothetical protein
VIIRVEGLNNHDSRSVQVGRPDSFEISNPKPQTTIFTVVLEGSERMIILHASEFDELHGYKRRFLNLIDKLDTTKRHWWSRTTLGQEFV